MPPSKPPLTVTVDVNHYYRTTLPCSAVAGGGICPGRVQAIIDEPFLQFFCDTCGRRLFNAVKVTEERANIGNEASS